MRMTMAVAAAVMATLAATPAARSQSKPSQPAQPQTKGAVELSGRAPVPQNQAPPKLELDNKQRETIRRAVLTQHAEVEFHLKGSKPDKDFVPSVGAKLPKGLKALALPLQVVRDMPKLAHYKYLTVKDKVLIVNPMSGKIVDMFSETQPVT